MKDKKNGRPLVYICSRYSGDTDGNAKKARQYSRFAAECGTIPIAPHLLFPQFLKEETERDFAMEMDIALLKRCDEVWVFGMESGVSDGMAAEIGNAGSNRQEVRYFTEDCREAFI